MQININSKIAFAGDDWAADARIIAEISAWFGALNRSDAEFYNCAKSGRDIAGALVASGDVFAVNPDICIIIAGFTELKKSIAENTDDYALSFALELQKFVTKLKDKGVTPVVCTCPMAAVSTGEELCAEAERSLKFCNAVHEIADRQKVYMVELHEDFSLAVLNCMAEGEPLFCGEELTDLGATVAGRIIAEELLAAGLQIPKSAGEAEATSPKTAGSEAEATSPKTAGSEAED